LIGDAQAFYAFAKSRDQGEPIAFIGYSTGAVTGLCLGDREPLNAVVVEGTFNPKTIVEDKHLYIAMPLESMFKSGVPDELDTGRCLQELKSVPVLFLHNRADALAPYDSARRLFDSYQVQRNSLTRKRLPARTRTTVQCRIQRPEQRCSRSCSNISRRDRRQQPGYRRLIRRDPDPDPRSRRERW
jgi:dienelactone hydrolase